MMRRMAAVSLMVLLWGVVALAVVAVAAKTNVLWRAETGYLLVAGAVMAAWVTSEWALSRLGVDPPYRPR